MSNMKDCNKCGKPIGFVSYTDFDGKQRWRPVEPGTEDKHICDPDFKKKVEEKMQEQLHPSDPIIEQWKNTNRLLANI